MVRSFSETTTKVTVLVFNFVGDGLRDAADPYKRGLPRKAACFGRPRGTQLWIKTVTSSIVW